MTRTLDLDFRRRRLANLTGWSLLAAGVFAAGFVLVAQNRVAAETADYQNALRRIEQAIPGAGREPLTTVELRAQDSTLRDMHRVQEQLNLPWGALFATLESLDASDVALISLAPDARKGELRISAEARNLAAMLEYHRNLEESDKLRDVSLTSHEIAEQVAERPVRFNLVATWAVE